MTRHSAPRIRAHTDHLPRLHPTATSQCVLGCVDADGHRRPAKKDSALCTVCDRRIGMHAKRRPAWRIQRQTVLTAWLAGFDHVTGRK
jgi:hypothetical protein